MFGYSRFINVKVVNDKFEHVKCGYVRFCLMR